MDKKYIDLNCDVGEGILNEEFLFPHISSCNIACGGHFGDLHSMKKSLTLAHKNQVKIGVHPSYPDKPNFGRLSISISTEELMISINNQISNFLGLCNSFGYTMSHIKPHGALYNDLAKNESLALAFLNGIAQYKNSYFLYVPFGSVVYKLAKAKGFRTKVEAFADRNYTNLLQLVRRTDKNALITEPDKVFVHLMQMFSEKKVKTVQGNILEIKAETFCLHGDTANALEILMYITKNLPKHNIYIK